MPTDESSVRIDVSRAAITSSINRARHPQLLLQVLTVEAVSQLLAFDYCSLVLPEADGQGIRVWRASRDEQSLLADDRFNRAETMLAQMLGDGSCRVIEERQLRQRDRKSTR